MLRIFGLRTNLSGTVPRSGLLVANHLSYLDIILLASLTPCVFVAKSDVARWPVFGWFARRAGTIFVNRHSRRDGVRASEEIRTALRSGALVVLFPEGTSSNGASVLPFKSSLLEAAIGERVPISVAALRYELPDGDAGNDVCYWGDHTLVPHLLKLMTKRCVHARVAFAEVKNTWRDRKRLATQLHAEVSVMHATLVAQTSSLPYRRPLVGCRFAPASRMKEFKGALASRVRRLQACDTADRRVWATRRFDRRMKIIITCGPSYEPIDGARRMTNMSTGKLGVTLANYLGDAGHNVICLRGEGSTYAGELRARAVLPFSTNDDLAQKLEHLSRTEEIDAVFHAAALCDYRVDEVLSASGEAMRSEKFATRDGRLTLVLAPATKVLPKLRAWFPHAQIVGWKYELAGTRDDAFAKAWNQLRSCDTDACVLNGAAYGSGFAVCQRDGKVEACDDADELFVALSKRLVRSATVSIGPAAALIARDDAAAGALHTAALHA